MIAIFKYWLRSGFSLNFPETIFFKEIWFDWMCHINPIPIRREITPGKIKAACQLYWSIKIPANKAPNPIPTPPKILLKPRARPVFFAVFTTQDIPAGW